MTDGRRPRPAQPGGRRRGGAALGCKAVGALLSAHMLALPWPRAPRQWLINAIVTPEKEILSSAGLDAVVMTWSLKIGISLFLPMAVIGCVLREWARRRACGGH